MRGWQVSGGWSRGRKAKQVSAVGYPTRVFEDEVAVRNSHRHFKNTGIDDVTADAYKLQTHRAIYALRLIPLNPARENRGREGEGLHVVDYCGHVPQAIRARERWFVTRLRALTLQGFQEGAFLAADISAGTDKNF